MQKRSWLIIAPLVLSLFIYLFFRTDKTLVNDVIISIVSLDNFLYLKSSIADHIHLNPLIVFSIPGGLWVFSFTLTAKNLFIRFKGFTLNCVYIPLIFALGLELLQLTRIVNGRFDIWDLVVCSLCWFVANYFIKHEPERQDIFKPFGGRSILFFFTYSIVYLAHVSQ